MFKSKCHSNKISFVLYLINIYWVSMIGSLHAFIFHNLYDIYLFFLLNNEPRVVYYVIENKVHTMNRKSLSTVHAMLNSQFMIHAY